MRPPPSDLDDDVNTGRKIQLLQLFNRPVAGVDDVKQTLVRTDFKLFHRFLVDVRGTVHRKALDAGRQRNRAGDVRARPLHRVDDFGSALIQARVLESLEPNANGLFVCHVSLFCLLTYKQCRYRGSIQLPLLLRLRVIMEHKLTARPQSRHARR